MQRQLPTVCVRVAAAAKSSGFTVNHIGGMGERKARRYGGARLSSNGTKSLHSLLMLF
jgi:hypothetical protein